MSKYSTKTIEVSEPFPNVFLVALNRKPVNAFNEAFWTDFGKVFDDISLDGNVRAIVLSSALPKLFTAGLDLSASGSSLATMQGTDSARSALLLRDHILRFQHAISAVERCRHPVIAAIHGPAIGLGIDITSACDIRYAASDAVFSVKEVDVGLAADIGTLARFPKATGNQSLVNELVYTARNFSAEEALSLGFVSKVVQGSQKEVVSAALETARLIASKSPVAVSSSKHILLHSRDHTVSDNLAYVSAWNAFAVQANDTKDAMAAFVKKKPAEFTPLPNMHSKL